ncbi:hypothetical protein TNCV_254511 [Trichonephila clavipes]|nr:hypothetical protein TNCV_254511 [Trichonephila clavipes]
MSEAKMHLRHCMLFQLKKGNNAMEAKRNLCDVFEEEAATARTTQRWFVKFCLGDFSLKNEPRSGRLLDVSTEVLRSMIKRNPT